MIEEPDNIIVKLIKDKYDKYDKKMVIMRVRSDYNFTFGNAIMRLNICKPSTIVEIISKRKDQETPHHAQVSIAAPAQPIAEIKWYDITSESELKSLMQDVDFIFKDEI